MLGHLDRRTVFTPTHKYIVAHGVGCVSIGAEVHVCIAFCHGEMCSDLARVHVVRIQGASFRESYRMVVLPLEHPSAS